MKLVSMQIFPRGSLGLRSGVLEFGNNITQLYGPNGCGKTPLVQSIAYCLGYPCSFRNDIYERCSCCVLTVETEKGLLVVKRVYSRDVDVEVTEPGGRKQRFFNEKDYSSFIFDWLNLSETILVTTSNKASSPYLSVILPVYYLDQDSGYSKYYCPVSGSFLKNQFSEVMRVIFDLPSKNSFESKKEQIMAKEKLDYLDKKLDGKSRQLSIAKQSVVSQEKTSSEIHEEIEHFECELDVLVSAGANHDDSVNAYDQIIRTHNDMIRVVSDEISEIRKRTDGISQIIAEINTEVETLSLNEEARRIFLSFDEICCSAQCQLFSSSSNSYSKNLLYLKDQIKDLQRNADVDRVKVDQLESHRDNLRSEIDALVKKKNASLEKSEVSALINALSEIKSQLFELESHLSDIKQIEQLKLRHSDLVDERDRALEKYNSFSADRNSIPMLIRVRSDLRELFLKWLDLINTRNISHDIVFRDDFTPVLGKETISQLKGSTRIRAVLAFHAALIELMAKFNKLRFRFLVLDTPKQHEVHSDDLDRYLNELKKVCGDHDCQIVFSTTEYHYTCDEQDIEWNPKYPGVDQDMFLEVYNQ